MTWIGCSPKPRLKPTGKLVEVTGYASGLRTMRGYDFQQFIPGSMKNFVLMSGDVRGSEEVANRDLSPLHELFALVVEINHHNSFEVYGQFATPWLNQRVTQISGQPRRATLLPIVY